jgi:hypothetical protein
MPPFRIIERKVVGAFDQTTGEMLYAVEEQQLWQDDERPSAGVFAGVVATSEAVLGEHPAGVVVHDSGLVEHQRIILQDRQPVRFLGRTIMHHWQDVVSPELAIVAEPAEASASR